MSDLISREATLEKIGEIFRATDPKGEEQFGVLKCSLMVREMPAVDAEPVRHGRWIEREEKTVCSSCETPLPTVEFTDAEYGRVCVEINKTPCCPNCGAHMDLEEDHD